MSSHPESRNESYGELQQKGRDVGCESDKPQIEDLRLEDEMVKDVIQNHIQDKIQRSASTIAKQVARHEPKKREIEEIDDRSQRLLNLIFEF